MDAVKRFVFTLVLVGLAGANCSAGESLRLDSLGIDVYEQVGLPAAGTDLMTVGYRNNAVNRAIQQVCVDYLCIERLDTLKVDSASEGGALPADLIELYEVVLYFPTKDGSGATVYIPVRLDSIAPDTVSRQFSVPAKAIADRDDPYAITRYRKYHGWLYPQPAWERGDTVDVQIKYYAMDSSLTGGSSVTQVPARLREAILWYACFLVQNRRRDIPSADRYKQLYDDMLVRHGNVR